MQTEEYRRVAVAQVIVEDRQRKVISPRDQEGLIASIKALGVLQPIIVTRQLVLVAGERRLRACQTLLASGDENFSTVPARFIEDLSPIELKIIELEENIKRSDLRWQETVRAVGQIHALYRTLDPDWTAQETAYKCSLTKGTVSIYMAVFAEIEDEKIAKCETVREALGVLSRRANRDAGEALQEILETTEEVLPLYQPQTPAQIASGEAPIRVDIPKPRALHAKDLPVEKVIHHESFLHWAPTYKGAKFNLVHCDFPYGVDLFAGPQAGGGRHDSEYSDSKDTYFDLLECFCINLDRFMAVSAHLMFWYSAKHHRVTMDRFQSLAPSLVFHPFPLVWVKSDNMGIASDVRHGPRHIYETCLFATRSNRQIVKVVSDVYSAPTDKRFHVSAKTESMLFHFMSMLVDENTTLLDPTCGSGSALHAAERLGARALLGLEVDERTVGIARTALRNARSLRTASREV